jgi:hypothetical protein
MQVWMWATALTYLAWRFQWRRDRRLAAEQYEREQEQELAAQQDWQAFAARYGVKPPQPPAAMVVRGGSGSSS